MNRGDRLSGLPSKLATLIRLPWRDRLLFFEAWLRLGMARLAILTVPVARLAAGWGAPMFETLRREPPQPALVGRVKWAVASASRHTPWKSNCLPQAMAGKRMLQSRGLHSTLYLGLMRESAENIAAHAWLRCGDVYVTGGRGARFVVVGTFAEAEASATSTGLPTTEVSDAFIWLKNK